jgi:hypothetical protein
MQNGNADGVFEMEQICKAQMPPSIHCILLKRESTKDFQKYLKNFQPEQFIETLMPF